MALFSFVFKLKFIEKQSKIFKAHTGFRNTVNQILIDLCCFTGKKSKNVEIQALNSIKSYKINHGRNTPWKKPKDDSWL